MSVSNSSTPLKPPSSSYSGEGDVVFYISNGINVFCMLPLLFQFPILVSFLLCGKPKDIGKVLTNIFHQIGWIIGMNGMPYTYVVHVIFVQLVGMGVLPWLRNDRAQTVVLCVMLHYCSVAVVVGYNKITALKIKPGCGPHHDYFFNTLVFLNLITRLAYSSWRPGWCLKGCVGVCNPFAICQVEPVLISAVSAIVIALLGIIVIRKRAQSAKFALEYEKGYVDAFDRLQAEDAKILFQANGLPVGFQPSEEMVKGRRKELNAFQYGNKFICFIGYGMQHVSYFIILLVGNVFVSLSFVLISALLFSVAYFTKKTNPPIPETNIDFTMDNSNATEVVKTSKYVAGGD